MIIIHSQKQSRILRRITCQPQAAASAQAKHPPDQILAGIDPHNLN
jgi:hypothetical protein